MKERDRLGTPGHGVQPRWGEEKQELPVTPEGKVASRCFSRAPGSCTDKGQAGKGPRPLQNLPP